MVFQWNWLRGPLAGLISARIQRPVAIHGDLKVKLESLTPRVSVEGLVVGGPRWAGPTPLASVARLTLRVKVLPFIFGGRLILPEVEVDDPQIDLRRDANGRTNWDFPTGGGAAPAIANLVIREGRLSYVDVRRGVVFAGVMSSQEGGAVEQTGFTLQGAGTYNRSPFSLRVSGGALLNIDPRKPYDFAARLDAAKTHLQVAAAIRRPFDLSRLSGTLQIRGDDLADLYHLTGLALPNTPPFALSGSFLRAGAIYALWDVSARLGQSDLSGSASVDDGGLRPVFRARLTSQRLRLIDLLAVIGGASRHAAAADLSAGQKVERARLIAQHRILPDASLDASRIRAMDAHVAYAADTMDAGKLILRDLRLGVDLQGGLLVVDPISARLPQGQVDGTARIDARQSVQTNAIDLRLTKAQLANLLPPAKGGPAIEGPVWARADLTAKGDSLRAAAAHADGQVSLVMTGGKVRKTLADLLGLDLGRTAFQLITRKESDTPVRCGVAVFTARDGVLTSSGLMFDTDIVKVTGGGEINLRDETLNLRVLGRPKAVSFARLDAPITITGRLDAPKIGVDYVKAAPQALAGLALGVFAAPLAAVLPFVAPNLSRNADCAALEDGPAGAPRAHG